MKYRTVTGFVPIPNHPRSTLAYGEFAPGLFGAISPYTFFDTTLDKCWLQNYIDGLGFTPTHSVADNKAKNTLAYHIVQHQKFEWIKEAQQFHPEADVFVWIDYGILHVPGITAAVISRFLEKLEATANIPHVTAPGCWDRCEPVDKYPCWRFCGGLIIVPAQEVTALYNAVQQDVAYCIDKTRNVAWEVNTLARIESRRRIPIRWYSADHNASMFDNFR